MNDETNLTMRNTLVDSLDLEVKTCAEVVITTFKEKNTPNGEDFALSPRMI
jgi:hypothetical protein